MRKGNFAGKRPPCAGGILGAGMLVVAAGLLLALALALPAHLRSVNDRVLAAAVAAEPGGATSPAVLFTDRAQVGPANLILASGFVPDSVAEGLRGRLERILRDQPHYELTGGPEPYLEGFLQLSGWGGGERANLARRDGVIALILPEFERRALRRYLAQSSNAVVVDLLEARSLSGLRRLQPADTAAGAPLDATLLLAGLLAQGNYWSPALSGQLRADLRRAAEGDLGAINAVEDFAIGLLSLARRLDYAQLAALSVRFEHPSEVGRLGAILRAEKETFAELYTVFLMTAAPSETLAYLRAHPKTGQADVIAAAAKGSAALALLQERGQPRFRNPVWAEGWGDQLGAVVPPAFARLALARPGWTLAFKMGAVFIAILLLAQGLTALFRSRKSPLPLLPRRDPLIQLRNAVVALFSGALLWCLTEPAMLRDEAIPPSAELRFNFALADSLETLAAPLSLMQNLNNITLLILALFFVIQLVIYIFCLIKLREISRQTAPPSLKLKLLENEENLFDFGLYVGLGGTVASLILVVMGVVEASLMAAYASTLFGILFVALVKIVHLRPFRRTLIIKAEGNVR